jgi:hypothetical protein
VVVKACRICGRKCFAVPTSSHTPLPRLLVRVGDVHQFSGEGDAAINSGSFCPIGVHFFFSAWCLVYQKEAFLRLDCW